MQGAYAGRQTIRFNTRDGMNSAQGRVIHGKKHWRAVVTMLVALAWGITIFSIVHHNQGVASADTSSLTYTVHEGDTLWSIAGKTTATNVDVRSVVLEIMKLNHMQNAQIYAGEKLQLPRS